jgi:hypothetical protein
MVGLIRSKEITQGLASRGGSWHPHDHLLLLWNDDADREADCAWIADRWADLIDAGLGKRPDSHGYHYKAMGADSAAYVTKLAHEAARGDLKSGSRSVWHIVDALADGEAWALRAWVELCSATKGKRAIQMSRGLREHFGLDPDVSDEELVAEKTDGHFVEKIYANKLARLMRCTYGQVPPIVGYLESIERRFADGIPPEAPCEGAPATRSPLPSVPEPQPALF